MINWPRMPELKEFEDTADHIIISGYSGMDELTDTSAAEKPQHYEVSADEKAGWTRLMRKMLDSKAPPPGTEQKRTTAFKELDIFAAIKANKALAGIGEILRTAQGAANLVSEALRDGSSACPPSIPFLPA